jgi:hypothetical protein
MLGFLIWGNDLFLPGRDGDLTACDARLMVE